MKLFFLFRQLFFSTGEHHSSQYQKSCAERHSKMIHVLFDTGFYFLKEDSLFRQTLERGGIDGIILPAKNAVIPQSYRETPVDARKKAMLQIKGLGTDEDARRIWKRLKGDHKRSLVETMVFRIK